MPAYRNCEHRPINADGEKYTEGRSPQDAVYRNWGLCLLKTQLGAEKYKPQSPRPERNALCHLGIEA